MNIQRIIPMDLGSVRYFTDQNKMEESWIKMGFISQEVKNFSAKEAFLLCRMGAILLDVREDYMNVFKQFKVENVLQMPLSILKVEEMGLSKNEYIVCADSIGLRSIEATKLLINIGFENVANLPGGIVDWESDGLPVETSKKERLSGSCMCQLKLRETK